MLVCDPERVHTRAHDLVETSQEFLGASWAAAAGGGRAPIDLGAAAYRTLGEVRGHAIGRGLPWWGLSPHGTDEELVGDENGGVQSRTVSARPADSYRGDTQRAVADLKGWLADNRRLVVVTGGHGTAERVGEVLADADVPNRLTDRIETAPDRGVVHISTGARTWLRRRRRRAGRLTEDDITGQRASTKDMRRLPSRRRNQVDPLQLRPGDHVVHDQHGVGRYVEMTSRTVAGATREYLVIDYAPSRRGQPPDRLYVPHQISLDQVTRYVGGDTPSLDRIGGSDWAKRKDGPQGRPRDRRRADPALCRPTGGTWLRVRAGHSVAARARGRLRVRGDARPAHGDRRGQARHGAFGADGSSDRRRRGYGKTEIAVRAAFKAVQDGKQAGVLVPTTLLVSQHYETFSERYAPFPVIVRPLSRFQSDREAADTLRGLAEGSVDVVIGTHRLLTGDVRFKDLGLLVVDEEQRFGVEHKEKLKQLRTDVDVLTMSATPIPRTLEMSITGIRDMSTITTPPEERHPVLTYVGAYDEKQIGAAIRREVMRDGQVFFVHNRVETIEKAASRLRELAPEARVVTAHGQMAEHTLEQVIADFWERAADVLVCTTIVETGLDISQREHAHRRPPGPARPRSAAPAPWSGRPWPGTRLCLLPLSTGDSADRGGARAAGDDRDAFGARRRHAGGDEGSRDPWRGQPARR